MPRQIPIKEVADAAISGIEKAYKFHDELSGGEPFSIAPEYLVTCHIAQSIYKLDGSLCLLLEHAISDIIECSGAKCCGKYADDLRKNGRSDIVLYWKKGDPRAIIEVKSPVVGTYEYSKDLYRIAEILKLNKKDHTLQFCTFAYYLGKAKNNLADANDKIYEDAKEIADYYGHKFEHFEKVHPRYDIPWLASCIIFKK